MWVRVIAFAVVATIGCRFNIDVMGDADTVTSDQLIDRDSEPDTTACSTRAIDEPGEDLCIPSYPDNFVPFAHVFSGAPASCGTANQTTAFGYLTSYPQVTFKAGPISLAAGDTIEVRTTTWASGSTSTPVQTSTSVNGTGFVVCDTLAGFDHLGNNVAHLATCAATATSDVLYVRLETLLDSAALIYIRTFQLDLPDACP